MRGRNLTPTPRRSLNTWEMFNRLFKDPFFNTLTPDTTEEGDVKEAFGFADWTPTVDITETKKAYKLKVEIPEVEKENIHVFFDNGVLTIEGHREYEEEEEGEQFHRMERSYGRFVRRFSVPKNIDDAKMTARFKNGMLYLMLPKATNGKDQRKRIEIT